MNTIHVLPPLDVDESRASMYLRTLAVTTLLCAAVFAACFLIGRAERRAGAPNAQLSSSSAAAVVGAAIPVRLATAPPIEVEAPVVAPVRNRSHAPVARSTAPAPVLVSAAPSAPVAATPTPSAPEPQARTPATAVVPATPQQPAPASRPTPAPASGASGGGASSETSGSTSFDSSG